MLILSRSSVLTHLLQHIVQFQILRPTWPVVITLTDVILKNREPMELGLQYSWRYWKSVQEAMGESDFANDANVVTPQSEIGDADL
jgi:hypothetical protein